MTDTGRTPTAAVVGAGLMGGSLGLALRAQGWFVFGSDLDEARAVRGVELGAFDAAQPSSRTMIADVTFICTPLLSVAELARAALAANPNAVVTDIGSVKGPVVAAVDHPRFVGGHPMAGSELDGIEGASATMFKDRTWVLTPTERTDPDAYSRLHTVIASLGATVVSVEPDAHDALVAVVSHVPHLAAATLMDLASGRAEEHTTLLRLAAGGFRDMTRIAAGHSSIWLDICAQNRAAIVSTLDELILGLSRMRNVVDSSDRDALRTVLDRARLARVNLPTGAPPVEDLADVRVPIPDRPGVIAEITTLASALGVNIYDIEMTHSIEGDEGVLVMVVAAALTDLFRGGLLAKKFRPSVSSLSQS